MTGPTRWLRAGATGFLAMALAGLVWSVTPLLAVDKLEELMLLTLGLQIFLGLTSVAVGMAVAARPAARLGLQAGRLSAPQVAGLALGTIALSHGLDGLLQVADLREGTVLEDLDQALAGIRGRSLVLALLGLALAPAVAEELMCRGLVQRGLEPRIGPALAVTLASVLFGVLHRDPVHAAAVVPLGLYLGATAWLAGSIRASIVCHLANNAAAVLGVAFAAPRPEALWTLPAAFGVAALALAVPGWRSGSPQRLERPPLHPL